MKKPTPEALIAAIRKRGNDATDLRDAAHEAHHALSAGVRGPWDRESIHRAVMAMGRADAAGDEIMARAVEQIVCADLGVTTDSIEKWAFWACMEAIKSGIRYPSLDWFCDAVRAAMKSPEGRRAADRVMALASGRARKPRSTEHSDAA